MFLESIEIDNPYTHHWYHFRLEQDAPHLILTGKNGTGKTTCLQIIADVLKKEYSDEYRYYNDEIRKLSFLYFDAKRSAVFQPVQGPTKDVIPRQGNQLHQILVNLRTQQAYANEEKNREDSEKYANAIKKIENQFKILFENESLELVFQRDKIQYQIKFNHYFLDFEHLPDGFNNLLHLWSHLWAEEEKLKEAAEKYFILAFIDEIETHLHVSLQKRVLYFLTQFFPRVQFFVTTHSPLVLSSVDNAVIYDLGENKRYLSKDLMGLNYGNLMMSHLGLASDFDLQTTAELAELKALHRNPSRTEEQTARMRALAQKLAEKSHLLALHIWEELSEVP
jgi:predicted ATP-binding protein involved in virulence